MSTGPTMKRSLTMASMQSTASRNHHMTRVIQTRAQGFIPVRLPLLELEEEILHIVVAEAARVPFAIIQPPAQGCFEREHEQEALQAMVMRAHHAVRALSCLSRCCQRLRAIALTELQRRAEAYGIDAGSTRGDMQRMLYLRGLERRFRSLISGQDPHRRGPSPFSTTRWCSLSRGVQNLTNNEIAARSISARPVDSAHATCHVAFLPTQLLRAIEVPPADADLLADHLFVSHKMRSTLIDWMAEVSEEVIAPPQVLFCAVNLLDQYMARQKMILPSTLQLTGTACLLVVRARTLRSHRRRASPPLPPPSTHAEGGCPSLRVRTASMARSVHGLALARPLGRH